MSLALKKIIYFKNYIYSKKKIIIREQNSIPIVFKDLIEKLGETWLLKFSMYTYTHIYILILMQCFLKDKK